MEDEDVGRDCEGKVVNFSDDDVLLEYACFHDLVV